MGVLFVGIACSFGAVQARAASYSGTGAQATTTVAKTVLGTVKEISGNNITLTVDGGGDVAVVVQSNARLLRIAPGVTDIKQASPLQLQDIQPGDRIRVRGALGPDSKSVLAVSIIAIKKNDISNRQAEEREAWQKHSAGGLVKSVDPATGTIVIDARGAGASKNVTVHVAKDTVLRRYAPGSVKFDDARPAPVDQIKIGDQLRARGQISADGSEVTAEEVVSGSFRNIAGTVTAIDTSAGTIMVMDLATKKPVLVKISPESQLKKLPPPLAMRIAARLKGAPAEGSGSAEARGAGGGSADMQQIMSRIPSATLADLNKGDAVMIVATPGLQDDGATAIVLLAGVEPILQAPDGGQSILSPWSLGSTPPGGEGGVTP